jgi:hypothetical protein
MGNHHWTPPEIKKVIDNFQIAPDFYIARLLPDRTPLAIAALRRRLDLKYTWEWMKEEMKKDRLSPYRFC